MKILVTGGAGYIGTVLIPSLLEQGNRVVLFDKFLWGVKPILHFAAHKALEIVDGDIRDESALREAAQGCEACFHLAAIVGYPACAADRHLAITTNVDGTRNVVNLIGREQQLIFASTGSTYGKVLELCTEATPIDPLTLYGQTKSDGEKMLADVGGISLRFATLFGVSPRLRLDLLVNDFVYQALHHRQLVLFEGHFRRTFLHVRDAAEALLFASARYEQMKGQVFNVGDEGMNYTKREVAQKIAEHIEYYLHEAEVGQDKDKRDYAVSYALIRRLGFQSTVSLDEGIAELIKVMRPLRLVNEWRNA